MGALAVVWNILYTLLLIYFFVMWARFVLDLVRTLKLLGCPSVSDLDESYVTYPADWRPHSHRHEMLKAQI